MEVRRTVPVKLAANLVVDHCRDDDGSIITAKNKLHERTYDRVREETDLHANMVQAARNRAADALKGILARWEDGQKASLPTFTADFAEYDKRSATFYNDHATLATVNGRITAEYVLPPEGDNHRTMAQIGPSFARWSEDLLHRISKAIIEEAIEHDCDTIVFEDLSEIRERISTRKKFQQWAFRRLYEYVQYKAKGEGLNIEQVDPAYTSQRCSKCGTTLKENREGDEFQCLKCDYELHADYNAAKNIGMKYVRREPTSHAGRATSHLALKSGTVNGNGRYSPASSEA